ncbi:hypothetical protein PCA01_31680 [Pseudoalteromonas carrageenovora]|nr:hypothetical protein PCA01_31680 [Pseudoalteromonas carrageenovora]
MPKYKPIPIDSTNKREKIRVNNRATLDINTLIQFKFIKQIKAYT